MSFTGPINYFAINAATYAYTRATIYHKIVYTQDNAQTYKAQERANCNNYIVVKHFKHMEQAKILRAQLLAQTQPLVLSKEERSKLLWLWNNSTIHDSCMQRVVPYIRKEPTLLRFRVTLPATHKPCGARTTKTTINNPLILEREAAVPLEDEPEDVVRLDICNTDQCSFSIAVSSSISPIKYSMPTMCTPVTRKTVRGITHELLAKGISGVDALLSGLYWHLTLEKANRTATYATPTELVLDGLSENIVYLYGIGMRWSPMDKDSIYVDIYYPRKYRLIDVFYALVSIYS